MCLIHCLTPMAVVVKYESAAAEDASQQPALCLVGIDAVAKGLFQSVTSLSGIECSV